jgi:hypothetical protein
VPATAASIRNVNPRISLPLSLSADISYNHGSWSDQHGSFSFENDQGDISGPRSLSGSERLQ